MNKKNIKNGSSYYNNGWFCVSIRGNPKERGLAYGQLICDEFKKIQEMLQFMCMDSYGKSWDFFIESSKTVLETKIKENFSEFYEEMVGIAEGVNLAGGNTTLSEVIAWNNFFLLSGSWYPTVSENGKGMEGGQPERCSAFICNGDYTKGGGIVCGHNNFSEFLDGQFGKQVLDIEPTNGGHRMLIQGFVGYIWSGTDFFVSSNGIFGTETTIGGFNKFENNYPISCRIRKAMQYGTDLDDYVNILLKENSGDYANSWLFGDTRTNEILRIELGLKYSNIERTKNGYFIGFNAAYDPELRNLECSNSGYYDIRRHQGARKVRLEQLMKQYKGQIDLEIGKKIMSDHYDVYLEKENPCSRTICSHYDEDPREFMSDPSRPLPFQPRGAIDGNLIDTNMAKNMSMLLKYGRSCDTPFIVSEFIEKHPQWIEYAPYLQDRPAQAWTVISISKYEGEMDGGKRKNKRGKIVSTTVKIHSIGSKKRRRKTSKIHKNNV